MHLTDEELERILREIARAAVEEMERGADRPPQGTGAGGTLRRKNRKWIIPNRHKCIRFEGRSGISRFGLFGFVGAASEGGPGQEGGISGGGGPLLAAEIDSKKYCFNIINR